MSFEVIQKVGKYKYIYLAEGYRNEDGKVRQRRRSIGKIDPKTGRKVYKPEYLEERRQLGESLEISPTEKIFSIEDVQKSSVRSFGQFHLYRQIGENTGLVKALEEAFPACWQEIFTLACFMISTSDPLLYCSEWISTTESYPVGSMKSQRISELLLAMTATQRNAFYKEWYQSNAENDYLALDITSTSSYSQLIDDVEWGYNRDHEKLPQIKLCMLMGKCSRCPLYLTEFSGSQKDVRTLSTILDEFEAITGTRSILLVMDKGFFSKRNMNDMLKSSESGSVQFLISVPFTSAFAKNQVESERKDIDCVENTIVINGQSMRAVTKVRSWNKDHKLYTHIYYNAKKASGIREELYAKVAVLRQEVLENPEKYLTDEDAKKYLIIRRSETADQGYTVNIRTDVVEKSLKTSGWVVLISNHIADAKKALEIYRDKDVVEKGFSRLKNNIDLGRLRVHDSHAMEAKLFVGFVASVIMSTINQVMADKGLYKKYTMKELLQVLVKHRLQEINGQVVTTPATKEQRVIYEAFGFPVKD